MGKIWDRGFFIFTVVGTGGLCLAFECLDGQNNNVGCGKMALVVILMCGVCGGILTFTDWLNKRAQKKEKVVKVDISKSKIQKIGVLISFFIMLVGLVLAVYGGCSTSSYAEGTTVAGCRLVGLVGVGIILVGAGMNDLSSTLATLAEKQQSKKIVMG